MSFSFRLLLAAGLLAFSHGLMASLNLQAGGDLQSVTVGEFVYVGQGATVVTMSGGGNAQVISVSAPLPGVVQGLAINGDLLYASWRNDQPTGQLALFSIAEAANPVFLGNVPYSTNPHLDPGGLALAGSTLYLVDGEIGLVPIDVSSPQQPVPGNPLQFFGLQRVQVYDQNTLLTWGRSFFGGLELNIFSITNPMAPELVGSYTGFSALNVVVGNGMVALVGDGVDLVSLANPSKPTLLSHIEAAVGFSGALVGQHLLLGWDGAIRVWDLSDPTNPQAGASIPAPADRARLFAQQSGRGNLLILTDLGLVLTVDVSDPATPTVLQYDPLPLGTDITAVAATDGAVLWTDFHAGLWVTDESMNLLSRVPLPSPTPYTAFSGIAIDDARAAVVDWGYGLSLIDISQPSAPLLLGSVEFEFLNAVAMDGDRAWAVTTTNYGLLVSFDLSDPTTPQIAGIQDLETGRDIRLQGAHLYTAGISFTAAVNIFDVSGPTPVPVGSYGGCNGAVGLDVQGALLALPCENGELHLLDISNPGRPQLLGIYSDPSNFYPGKSALIDGDFVHFGHNGGIDLIDVSNPSAPVRLERVPLATPAWNLAAASSGGAWVASGQGGGALTGATGLDPELTLGAGTIDFSLIPVGGNNNRYLILTNTGGMELLISEIVESGPPFAIEFNSERGAAGGQCSIPPFLLEPGVSCFLRIIFAPESAGSFDGSLVIMSDSLSSPDAVSLSGVAGASPQAPLGVPVLGAPGLLLLILLVLALGTAMLSIRPSRR